MFQPILIALQFLTQFPVRFDTQPNQDAIGRSIIYYPVIGLFIGSILAALCWLLSGIPPLVTSSLLLISWVLMSGGLHLDGLADSVDAWIGGMGDRERTLVIMKDPNCGPAGVVAIFLLLLLKFVTIYTLLIADEWVILILAAILGRTILPLLLLTTPYVRANGLGTILVTHMPRRLALLSVAITTLLVPLFLGINSLWVLLTVVIMFWGFRRMILRRIGGTTGDTAGALVELTETSVLLTAILTVV